MGSLFNGNALGVNVGTSYSLLPNSESSLKESQNNYYTALYDFVIAKIDLDKAQGLLVTE